MLEKRQSEFYEGKRVCVTGGAGFVGSHLVEMLVELGAAVTVPVRESTSLRFLKAVENDISIIQADLFDRKSVDRIIGSQEIVLHLAAAKGGGIVHSMSHHGSLFRDNMLSFINTIDSAHRAGVARFLVVSSACVYPRESRIPIPEEAGFQNTPEPTNAGYGWSKRMEEFLASSYVDEYGMNIGIVRPFNAYGPRDDFFNQTNHVIPGLITRLIGGENPLTVWGSGNQTRSFLYVTDFARGVLAACAHKDVTGPLNLGNDEEISIGDLAKMIVEVSGLKVAVSFETSKPEGQPRRSCDTRKAKEQIGFQTAVSLRDGLIATMDWYRKEAAVRKGES